MSFRFQVVQVGLEVLTRISSVTPLKANFMHAAAATDGELKL